MSIRQYNLGSIVKPGFNPLGAQTNVTTYFYYLYGWGQNTSGQLGIGNTTNRSSPNQVGALYDWSQVSCANLTSFSLKTDGTIWSWGSNSVGQMGISGSVGYNFSSPRQIGSLTTWTTIKGGYNRAFAVRNDGTLWAWGSNQYGQLGDGTTTNRASPNQVGALTNWLAVAGGYGPVAAVKTDGTLWTWGYNASGQLGLGNTTSYSSPKQVGSLTTWLKVSSRVNTCYAIKTDGTLWSWGANNYGQLGIGNTINYSSPKQIGALTNWLTIAACSYFALAVKTNGTLWAWGNNGNGELGLGNTTSRSSPNQIGALTTWSGISESWGDQAAATSTDGKLWIWGANQDGQLGLGDSGTYTKRSSPTQVGSLTTWGRVDFGNSAAIGLLY